MGKNTEIGWTDHSWPIVNGCRRVSPGCENCYAERLTATRLRHTPKYAGLASYTKGGPRWTGATRLWEKDIEFPLRITKPSRIFVADMGDLFYEGVSDETIASVIGICLAARKHTMQILTKRAERMAEFFRHYSPDMCRYNAQRLCAHAAVGRPVPDMWPAPNLHLGVSAEDQKTAADRIPTLLGIPALVHWVSLEPLLGEIDLIDAQAPFLIDSIEDEKARGLDWVVVGGESGPHARTSSIARLRSIVRQCRKAQVPVYVKQVGARPLLTEPFPQAGWPTGTQFVAHGDAGVGLLARVKNRKGANAAEWPEDLRVQEFPRIES